MKASWLKKIVYITVLLTIAIIVPPMLTFTAWAETLPAGSEVLSNTSFEDDLNYWEIFGKPEEVLRSSYNGNKGVQFPSTSGNNSSGIRQWVNMDVSDYSKVILTAAYTVKLQTLSGTGWQGREAPFFVFVTYLDVNGVMHDQLPIYPGYYRGEDQSRRMYWNGFYYLDPDKQSMSKFGIKVEPREDYDVTIDLMEEISPKPQQIFYVGAGGSGWPNRDSFLYSMSLKVYPKTNFKPGGVGKIIYPKEIENCEPCKRLWLANNQRS